LVYQRLITVSIKPGQVQGVAKGTVYLYVESKEALFDLACRLADTPDPPLPSVLPVRTPTKGATLEYITARLSESPVLPLLRSMVAKGPQSDPLPELELLVEALYDDLFRNRRALKLVGQSARDLPEIAAVWFDATRGGLVSLLGQFLSSRIAAGSLAGVPDVGAAARTIIETAVFWAVHRHWDPRPQAIEETAARATVLHFARGAFTLGGTL
jgi:AcrR family transcriptional regulator